METPDETDDEQTKLWNGPAGRAWVEGQELLDQMLKPFEALLVEAVSAQPRHRVLDVGCGTGSTTVAVARLLGANGQCVGVDVSEPMIAAATARAGRERTPPIFIRANAQVYRFEPASFDMIISRLGVMFFADPIRAFANLRRAAKDDAELRFVAFRGAAENRFMTTAERAAASLLPNLPARRQDGPGQFAFANGDRVRAILQEGGWSEVDVRPIDVACTLPEKELIPYLTHLGPVGRALQEVDDETRAQVITVARAAFDPYVHGAEVRLTAACWMASARSHSA